ncbi:MAG: cytochrome B [Legionellales bacterium RIFCSPHIGHO2_12_FULL_35_11]|nr:MAG: cytochrome B [Legionellales bacterium RIFCSPHIGHO2_12_FULL_35_11]
MKILYKVSLVAVFLALFVVMLGAYTRLTDAGLGCPDWPTCYGNLVLPSATDSLSKSQKLYPDQPIEAHKAWTEMAHRYLAGSLVLLILFIVFNLFKNKEKYKLSWQLPLLLILLVIFQAALGMWTVTLKLLPIVVIGHLLGGMLIFSSLVYICWNLSGQRHLNLAKYRNFVNLGLIIVFCQIILGGLVSANYAGIACAGFPTCNGQFFPDLDFIHAFNLFSSIGDNYQGGLLDNASRVTLQMTHRVGAIVTLIYIVSLTSKILFVCRERIVRIVGFLTLIIVLMQFMLGIINVIYLLPLGVAVLHNGMAALLLGMMVSLRYLVATGDKYAGGN